MHLYPANPGERRVHASTEAFRCPELPAGVRFALLMTEGRLIAAKPLAFESLAGLARSIHRRRGDAGLQLKDTELRVRRHGPAGERDDPRLGVSIWTTDPSTGDSRKYLGWAYLRGAGRELLQQAIRENELA